MKYKLLETVAAFGSHTTNVSKVMTKPAERELGMFQSLGGSSMKARREVSACSGLALLTPTCMYGPNKLLKSVQFKQKFSVFCLP